MKEPTPSGWIGVLIGIVVFGSIVGSVNAATNCPNTGNKLNTVVTDLIDMTKAFTATNYLSACTGSGTDKCIQYYPPPKGDLSRKGKAKLLVECGGSCPPDANGIKTKMGGSEGYRCTVCDTDNAATSCKFIEEIKKDLTECYSVATAIDKNSLDARSLATQQKNLCMDECQYLIGADSKVKLGCKDDLKADTKCPVGDVMCEHMIAKEIKCYADKDAGAKIAHVTNISKALNRENWTKKCAGTDICLIYYPPSDTNQRKGKVNVLVECGASCITDSLQLNNKIGENYRCSPCDPTKPASCNIDVKTSTTECYDYSGDKNNAPDTDKDKKIYCMDSCVYFLDGKALTVGCDVEVKKKGTPTKCPDADRLCENMILKSKGGDQGGGPPTTNNQGGGTNNQGGGTNNQGGGPTTPARKHGNRVIVPTSIIGSMAILLFAASKYGTFLN